MRRRAYRPEILNCLEDRALSSVAGAQAAHPVVFQKTLLSGVINGVHSAFNIYAGSRSTILAYNRLQENVSLVPYEREDGLDGTMNGILGQMERQIAAGARLPILRADRKAVAAVYATLGARIRAGDVILR